MLQPKRTKFRKAHKGRIKGLAKGGFSLSFGGFGLKALEPERVTARQIEAARRAITRAMKRQGRVWIRIFPDVPVSTKPAEVRMGSGKGAPEYWVARIKPGRMMFEIDGVSIETAREALTLGAAKLPIRTKIADIRAKTPDELQTQLLDLRKEQFNLRFQRATGQLEATGRIKLVRRDIARIKFVLSERRRSAASQPKA